MSGHYQFTKNLLTGELGRAILESPNGNIMLGGRMKQMYQVMKSMTVDPVSPYNAKDLFIAFGQMFPQVSDGMKCYLAAHYHKKFNSYGGVVDKEVGTLGAIAAAFGVRTVVEQKTTDTYDILYRGKEWKESDGFRKDVRSFAKAMLRQRHLGGAEEVKLGMKLYAIAQQVFEVNPNMAYNIIADEWNKAERDGEVRLYDLIARESEVQSSSDIKAAILASPLSKKAKELRLSALEDIDRVRKNHKEGK